MCMLIVQICQSTRHYSWSFGVLMYEIFSMGRIAPYSNVQLNNILTYLDSDGRLERPIYAADDVYKLMLDCWHATPANRPSFVQVSFRTRFVRDLCYSTRSYAHDWRICWKRQPSTTDIY